MFNTDRKTHFFLHSFFSPCSKHLANIKLLLLLCQSLFIWVWGNCDSPRQVMFTAIVLREDFHLRQTPRLAVDTLMHKMTFSVLPRECPCLSLPHRFCHGSPIWCPYVLTRDHQVLFFFFFPFEKFGNLALSLCQLSYYIWSLYGHHFTFLVR